MKDSFSEQGLDAYKDGNMPVTREHLVYAVETKFGLRMTMM